MINLIDYELSILPNPNPKNIFIGGFASGGSVCLASILRIYKDLGILGGVIAVSAALPLDSENILVPAKMLNIPVLLYTGKLDDITDVQKVKETAEFFKTHLKSEKQITTIVDENMAHKITKT